MSEPTPSAAERNLAALRAHLVASGVPVETMARLRNAYMNTPDDTKMRDTLETALTSLALVSKDPERIEGRGIAVVAESGAGKSRRILRMLASHPLFVDFGKQGGDCPAIRVRCPQSCTLAVLGELILAQTGYPIGKEVRENVAWRLVRKRLPNRGILLIYIDEINNLIENSNRNENKKNRNALKALLNNPTWPVVLVLAGTPSIAPVLQLDTQLRRRVSWLDLEPVSAPQDNAMFTSFVEGLCKVAQIGVPEDLATDCVPRLIHAGLHRLGIAADLAVNAVERALMKAEPLEIGHFASAYGERTGCTVDQNPFLSEDWAHVDCSIVLSTLRNDEED